MPESIQNPQEPEQQKATELPSPSTFGFYGTTPVDEDVDPLEKLFTPRSAGEIIDLALRENEKAERAFIWISIGMAIVGLTLLILSGFFKSGPLAFSGFSASSLCGYSLRLLWKIRTERYALRLTELLLEKATSAEEAARVLSKIVETVFKPGLTFSSSPWIPRAKGSDK